jgi:hypothetical protein
VIRPASAWRHQLGDPPVCSPGDHGAARDHLARVERVIDAGGWTRNERTNLYRERDKWRRRAEGRDVRFEVAGNRAGPLTISEQAKVIVVRATVEFVQRLRK